MSLQGDTLIEVAFSIFRKKLVILYDIDYHICCSSAFFTCLCSLDGHDKPLVDPYLVTVLAWVLLFILMLGFSVQVLNNINVTDADYRYKSHNFFLQ